KGMNLDFFVLCSSQRSILGGPGQAGYCAANAFLDAFASTRSLKQKPFTVSIVWDAWKDVGISAGLDKQFGPGESQQDVLKNAMLNEEGVDAFRRILGSPLPVVVVSTEDFQVRLERYKALTVSQVLEEFERTRTPNSTHPRPQLRNLYVAPRNKIEQTLADIWQQLLGIEQVGIQDNFFELGGDSVISIQIIARARQAGLQLTPKQVFHHQTIAKLAS